MKRIATALSFPPQIGERWLRFNLVGLLGMGVQFAALACFSEAFGMHYVAATVLAVETAVLHNFVWHTRWTWRDRLDAGNVGWGRRLFAFHITNGLVSVIGNALLMSVFHGMLRAPVLVANAMAIVACSLFNFALSEAIVFRGHYERWKRIGRRGGERAAVE
jgi:putative flippase GtrA